MTIETTYAAIKEQANTCMKRGDVTGYLKSLIKLQQLRLALNISVTAK